MSGGGGGISSATNIAPPDGVNSPFTTPGTGGVFFGAPTPMTAGRYNQQLMQGQTDAQMRDTNPQYSNNQWNDIVTQAGMQSPTGRPLAGSGQFYQPQYQPQYQNYAMTNPLGVSQYGQSFGGYSGGYYGGMGGYGMPMQSPFNPYTNSFQTPFSYMQQGQPPQQAQVSQPNYGPSQAIVSRSAGMRGTPNVVRRAEGGIASLVDDE